MEEINVMNESFWQCKKKEKDRTAGRCKDPEVELKWNPKLITFGKQSAEISGSDCSTSLNPHPHVH